MRPWQAIVTSSEKPPTGGRHPGAPASADAGAPAFAAGVREGVRCLEVERGVKSGALPRAPQGGVAPLTRKMDRAEVPHAPDHDCQTEKITAWEAPPPRLFYCTQLQAAAPNGAKL